MRPISVLLPGGGAVTDVAAIAVAQAVTAGTPMTLTTDPFVMDVVRQATLTFTGDESANFFSIVGRGAKGNSQHESLAGTAAGTIETEMVWSQIDSITPQFAGAANVSAGIVTNIRTAWQPVDYVPPNFSLGISVILLTGAGGTVTVQTSKARLNRSPSKGSIFRLIHPTMNAIDTDVTALNSIVATGNGVIVEPLTAVRLNAEAAITGAGFRLEVVQGQLSA